MRAAFVAALVRARAADPKVLLLSGDLGYRVLEAAAPINCGIAEANMVSVAAGLAMTGHRPFVYSIAPFLYLRALEQIKIDVCFNRNKVKLVGVGAGVDYGHGGPSHYSLDDIAILRNLPGMSIYCPADAEDVRCAVEDMLVDDGPGYLRLANRKLVDCARPREGVAPIFIPASGKRVIVSCGATSNFFFHNLEALKKKGVSFAHVPKLPANLRELGREIAGAEAVWCAEDHQVDTGLAAEVSTALADFPGAPKVRSLGFRKQFADRFGGYEYLRRNFAVDLNSFLDGL